MEAVAISEARALYRKVSETFFDEKLVQHIQSILQKLSKHPTLQDELMDEVVKVIEETIAMLEPIEDTMEIQGVLTVRYARIKADWVILNTKTQYIKDTSSREYFYSSYLSSILTVVLIYMEPFIDEESRRIISQVLFEPVAVDLISK